MKYLAVLGRQPEISLAELESLFGSVQKICSNLAEFESETEVDISRLGGTLKLAQPLDTSPLEYLQHLPDGKITLGLSDYNEKSSRKVAAEALRLKKILSRHGRSMRIVPNREAVLSTATVFHNQLGRKKNCIELIKYGKNWYVGCGVQDIDAYTKRDQVRPARDAKVGMLPPKLAQILINLCGPLPVNSRILDPFCGTGVVLQEATLMGYVPYGTDLDERMIKYSKKNLEWLDGDQLVERSPELRRGSARNTRDDRPLGRGTKYGLSRRGPETNWSLTANDATTATWQAPINAVASEIYLGPPLDHIPTEVELQPIKQEISSLLLKFLKNLTPQIASGTPVTLAIPAWLRPDGDYETLNLLDEIAKLGYNVKKYVSDSDLLYHRAGQVVARQIITLRKK